MRKTRAQVQLQYHQTLNRICEMELLAEQLLRLAGSYSKEERRSRLSVKEADGVYLYTHTEDSPGAVLQAQAEELKAVAGDWYRQAREAYRDSLREIQNDEERRHAW